MASGRCVDAKTGQQILTIDRLGAQGDGVVDTADGSQFVPQALPGERWCQVAGGGFERLNDAPERTDPPCMHFGACGGCVAQHMQDTLYTDWKTGMLRHALAHQGIDVQLGPLWRAPPGSRRRLTLSAELVDGRVRLGFRETRSHTLVEITACTIAMPEIVNSLPVLGLIMAEISGGASLPKEARLHVLRADNGIDVLVSGIKKRLSASARQTLAVIAQRGDILRLTVDSDEIYQSAQPVLQIAGGDLRVPPGAFVQAVAAAETVMAAAVVKALDRAKYVADLFCGLGAFTLPLAKQARVLAVDSQPDAIAALADAVRRAQGLKPVESLRRDLFREPLSRNELKPFDAVVFDPPRAGAAAQAEALAKSKVPLAVAISCNPATLARDLRILVEGGFKLQKVTPIDQFLYGAHVEAIAILRR
ncbi:MAG: class I SAM-dependent RNA methyltransferase [Hyphomicrobiaceae bacterium]